MLRAQGWTPGQNLGAQDAAHASFHTAASAAPIKVVVKDDFLGLGAKIRQKQSDECTGLDVFKDLLGRLNGKSEESIEQERKVRSDIKTNIYVENKFGLMRFVSGGLLVGDHMQDLVTKKEKVEEDAVKTEDEDVKVKEEETSDVEVKLSSKKDKKSKKRKAEDAEQDESRKEKSSNKKKRKKAEAENDDDSSDESSRKKKKKSKSKSAATDSEDETAKAKDKKKKRKEKKLKEAESAAASTSTSDVEDAVKRRKREKKEKKRRKQQEADESTASTTPMAVVDTPAVGGTATPVESGTSTPRVLSGRHLARSRNIASKRQAMADMKSLNQVSRSESLKHLQTRVLTCLTDLHGQARLISASSTSVCL